VPRVSEPVYRIGFRSDAHLFYPAGRKVHPGTGLNMRVRDGLLAFRQTMDQMIEAEVDMILDGGDIMHASHPPVMAIVFARQQILRAWQAGIPYIGNTGNHDASDERGKSPATAALHDPDRHIEWVTEPYRMIEPVDGLAIHMISHYGLAQTDRIVPEPVDGVVNILSSHGAAMVPGHEVFRCVDSPREQAIGLDLVLDDRYAVKALGHYHGMDEILPGTWYAGSAIRRGFSDPAGGRGWLLMNVFADGHIEVERKYIDQRPQFDLPAIDAKGLTGSDVEERIRANLAAIDIDGAILRQVVTNCTTSVRRGIDQPALDKITASALMWMTDFKRPNLADTGEQFVAGPSSSLASAGSANLPQMYSGWAADHAESIGLAAELRPVVAAEAEGHLRAASEGVETGTVLTTTAPAPRNGGARAAAGTATAVLDRPVATAPSTDTPVAAPRVDAATGWEAPW
jgi:hypothetical protein